MYWILTETELSKEEFEKAMKLLFPNLIFLYYDVENDENNDWENIFKRDEKHITYSIVVWSEKIKSKLELYDFPDVNSIERTQYIGQFLSKYYNTKVVTELNSDGDTKINLYHSLLIDSDNLNVIDDFGIESNNYDYKILTGYNGQVQKFDDSGFL